MSLNKRCLAIVLALAATNALSADRPVMPGVRAGTPTVTIVVPFSHGGPTDELARILSEPLGKALQRKVVERNILGAGGTLGTERVSRATPDGTTLLLSNIGQATSPALYRNLRYDPVRDFEPVGLVADVPMMLVGRRDLAAVNFKELLRDARGGLTYAHAGIGSASHLCGVLLRTASRANLRTIPYQGTQEALSDLAGGHVDLLCDQPTNTLSAIRAGHVRPYAVTGKARLDILPDVPTMNEAGLPGFDLVVWHGLYAPKGTPPEVIDRLAAALRKALADPTLKARMIGLGALPATAEQATPQALRARLSAEIERWQPIFRDGGTQTD
jgi:tripartite-type tricarboxylate transporter receptor subunit TctC